MSEDKACPIALVDMDNSIAKYEESLLKDLDKLRSPNEPINWEYHTEPDYIRARMDLIRLSSTWWENLPPITRGLEIVNIMRSMGFRIVICTQGPRKNAAAWQGKMLWVQKNLPDDTDIIITRDKGLIYGNVLMDDFPDYITNWLKHRPRGLVIMPAHHYNKDFSHSNVIRDDGSPEATEKIKDGLNKIILKDKDAEKVNDVHGCHNYLRDLKNDRVFRTDCGKGILKNPIMPITYHL